MTSSVLDEALCRSILFEVLDGIPASDNECDEALRFRQEIECNEGSLISRAQELGLDNPMAEFSSSGEA